MSTPIQRLTKDDREAIRQGLKWHVTVLLAPRVALAVEELERLEKIEAAFRVFLSKLDPLLEGEQGEALEEIEKLMGLV